MKKALSFGIIGIIVIILLAGCSKEADVTKQDDSEGDESVQTENRMILTING